MQRKLATVRRIKEITAIENADNLELAKIDGWQVVVKKGEFKPGDLVVYCEIDSFLPIKPEFEFLRKSCYKKMFDDSEGFRIKTIKLRGIVSQGICFSLDILNQSGSFSEGFDVTEQLGIKKYEKPIPAQLAGEVLGPFPSFIEKTDEERVQNLVDLVTENIGHFCYVTEKLDGTSATFFIKDRMFGVCSRNYQLKYTETNTYWKVAIANNIEEKLKSYEKNIAIQGEIIGAGIQGNKYRLTGQDLYIFNVFDIDNHKRFSYEELRTFVDTLGFNMVPITNDNFILHNNIPEMIATAGFNSKINGSTISEGIVIRSKQFPEKISFKVINPTFLLRYEE